MRVASRKDTFLPSRPLRGNVSVRQFSLQQPPPRRHSLSFLLGLFVILCLLLALLLVIPSVRLKLSRAIFPNERSLGYWEMHAERHLRFKHIVRTQSLQQGVSPELVWAIIRAESNFDPVARSHKGAQGLMQLMPATAAELGVTDPYDPYQNIYGGTKYLRFLLDEFDGNWELAIAAYNAGPGSVKKYRGIPPFRETKSYVAKVLKFYKAERQQAIS